ncbi:MAG: hypothetical protein D6692_10480 [Planctomycetota bacterium]|nr:MAG: hypothetical protein D6692_10480 [Planctomycetota bacterium]
MNLLEGIVRPIIGPVVERLANLIPDPQARAKAKEEMERELLRAWAAANAAQTEINRTEAAHKSLFVAGWRPAIGWVCAAGIAYAFIVQPLTNWVLLLTYGPEAVQLPSLETGPIFGLATSMLGLAGLRSWEKSRGVAREQ